MAFGSTNGTISISDRSHANLGPLYLAISWTTVTLATVLVTLRLYVRCKLRANDWDDYLIYLALVSVYSS